MLFLVLFNLSLEKVVREGRIEYVGVKLGSTKIGLLACTDDVVLLVESEEDVIEKTRKLLETAKWIGLEVNMKKREYMIIQRKGLVDDIHTHLEVDEYKVKRVQEFIYPGSCITQKNEIQAETRGRIQVGDRWFYGLNKILKSRKLFKSLKI